MHNIVAYLRLEWFGFMFNKNPKYTKDYESNENKLFIVHRLVETLILCIPYKINLSCYFKL